MKLPQGKNNLFQSPSPEILMLETSRFARLAVCAPTSNAGLGFFVVVVLHVASGTRVPLKQIKRFEMRRFALQMHERLQRHYSVIKKNKSFQGWENTWVKLNPC